MPDDRDPLLEAYFGPYGLFGAGKCAKLPLSRCQPWGVAGVEPPLCELLDDPLIHLVMRRDGVTRAKLRDVIRAAQQALGVGLCRCAA